MNGPLHVLAIEPFHGGSHRAFLDGVVRHSRHRWTLLTGSPVHWKWRSRSAPLELAAATHRCLADQPRPDLVFCSEMLDLPTWRGMLRDGGVSSLPTVAYFHENQWTYPLSPTARVDFHYGYTNLLTALASDLCLFNSAFHRDEFVTASEAFVRRMPDTREAHDFDQLRLRCEVLPTGFDPPDRLPTSIDDSHAGDEKTDHPLRIGWVSRWEHDKRPDLFVKLVDRLDRRGVDFRLVLAGSRSKPRPDALQELYAKHADRILWDGFAESGAEYWRQLQSMDVVVSTADHEFFGIAVCEAVWAGAVPVLPRRLSYPELFDDATLYEGIDQAAARIEECVDVTRRQSLLARNRDMIETLQMRHTVKRLDERLQRLAAKS